MYKAGRDKTHHIPYYHHDYHVSGNVNYPPAYNASGDRVQGEEMIYHTYDNYDHVPIRVDYSENDHYDSNRRRYHESHEYSSHHHESPVYPDLFSEGHGGQKSYPLPSGHGRRPVRMEQEHGGGVGDQFEAQVITPVEEHVHKGKLGHEARPGSGYKDIYRYEDVDEVAVEFLRKEHELFERAERLSMQARR